MSGDRLLYLYAIVDRAPTELGTGLEDAPLRAVKSRPLAAVFSEHESVPEGGEEELWCHEAVVERLMEEAVVLPLRFGATLAGEDELEELLRSRGEEFVGLLTAVRGAVELSVRAELAASDPDPEPAARSGGRRTGTEYMRERGRALRQSLRTQERLHRRLTAQARRSVLFGPGPATERFRGAYLVDGDRVGAFAQLVERLARELSIEISCTGPWPPYSFVARAEG